MFVIARILAAAAVLGAVGACGEASSGGDEAETQSGLGRLQIALTGETASGHTYQLRDAIITVVGPKGEYYFDSEADPDASQLTREVPEGEYRLFLEDGWRLDRLESDGSVTQDVPAAYVSNNPEVFYVYPNETELVFLKFQAGDQVASFGSFDVRLAVEELDDETPNDDETPADGETPADDETPGDGETPADDETPSDDDAP